MRKSINHDALSRSDCAVFSLIQRKLAAPVHDDVHGISVNRLTIFGICTCAAFLDQSIQLRIIHGIVVGVGAFAVCVGAVVNLGHIRVNRGLPCSCPHHSGVGLKSVVPDAGSYVVHLQLDAELVEHFAGCNGYAVCRVILLSLSHP